MNPFALEVLLWPAGAIFGFTLFVTLWSTRSPIAAMSAGLIKAAIFLVYFGWVFHGTFTFLDDWDYLKGGSRFLAANVGVTNLVDHWSLVLGEARGPHFVYYLYNAYAFRIFGEGYYAPVACNILLTPLIACLGARLAVREFGLSPGQSKWFYLFLLFHPDILAWSSIMNGKDILVLLLHVLLLISVSLFCQQRLSQAIILGLSVVITLFFLRFYVPILFAVALVVGTILARQVQVRPRIRYLLLSIIVGGLLVTRFGESGILKYILHVQEQMVNPIYGFVRFILTPIPFHTVPAYAFLNIPSLIHWLLFPFVVVGFVHVFGMGAIFARFFLIYLLAFIGLYAVFGELQGPRHRVQLDYAWATLQFLGLILMFGRTRVSQERVEAVAPTCDPVAAKVEA